MKRDTKILIGLIALLLAVAIIFPQTMLGIPFVAMALGRDRERFAVKGGGLMKSAILASGGVLNTMSDLGWIMESQLVIDKNVIVIKDERGFVVNAIEGGEDWKFDVTLGQVSLDEINLILNGPIVYRHFYYCSQLASGIYQEVYIPLAKITNPVELPFKAGEQRKLKCTIQALIPKGAVTVTPAGFNVPVDCYGIIVENAVKLGEVTTTSGTIFTAAV